MNTPMTPEQIKNFREAMCFTLGPYALIMPDEEVIKLRDKLQERLTPHKGAGGGENGNGIH